MPAPDAASVVADLRALADPAKAKVLAGFFKTGPGQYGEGDLFWGVTVPRTRAVVKAHRGLALPEIEKLVGHPVHEVRLAGWLALVGAYEGAKKVCHSESEGRRIPCGTECLSLRSGRDSSRRFAAQNDSGSRPEAPSSRRAIFDFYLAHARRADNWDLVDVSAPNVVGDFLLDFSDADRTAVLRKLATPQNLWERRVAVLATFAFIRAGRFHPAVAVCRGLLRDPHDLIHKACGWMLREMGKRGGLMELRAFLAGHAVRMPRTMLRYAVERLEPAERARWMGA